jgi:hypothetical protein
MISLIEWCVEFEIRMNEEDNIDADEVMCAITRWAESHNYGVGGGYDHHAGGSRAAFRFGLCATQESQLIPEADVRDLVHMIRSKYGSSAQTTGGYRPYSNEEADPEKLAEIFRRFGIESED